MPEINYYLKKPSIKTGKSLIYLQFRCNGRKLVYSTGQQITPKHWNSERQRVKQNKETLKSGDFEINALLDNMQNVCEVSYKEELKNGIPTVEIMRKHLSNFLYQNEGKNKAGDKMTLFKLIKRFVAGEIKHRGKDKSKCTLNNYRSVMLHLEEFQDRKKYKVDFDTINLDFFYKYVSFLKSEKKLSQNTIAKDISILKTFMSEAVDLNYSTNNEFRHRKFSVEGEQTDAVYLTEKEIIKLFRTDLSTKKRLEKVRDLFVFGCFVGLRYSDYSNVKPENIVWIEGKQFLKIITQKTKELVIIPCHPIVLEIFEKYKGNSNQLPNSVSGQKFNKYLKDACKEAGFTEQGRLSTQPSLMLWQCASSHTARRSFATNLYLDGYPTSEIMKITGHRSERSFNTYIRVSKLDAALRLGKFIEKKWSSKMLVAV